MKSVDSIYQRILIMDSAYWLNVVIILALSILSFYTTFDGFSRYILTENKTTTVFEITFLIIVVVIIQLLLIVSLANLIRHKTWRGRLIWIILYMMTMLVSVFFSYSFYYKLMQADSYAQENFTVQLNQSLLDAEYYQSSFMDITHTVNKLSGYSQDTAKKERLKGGTCGDHSPAGAGPRRDLREEEAKLFAQLSESTTDLSKKLAQEIENLNQIKASYAIEDSDTTTIQQKMNTVIHRINHQRNAATLKQLEQDLQQHSGEYRQKLWVEIRQTNISCPDRKISQAIKGLLISLNDLPTLAEITLFDAHNEKAVMARAMQVFISIPELIYNTLISPAQADDKSNDVTEKQDADAISYADLSPFIFGGMVDSIIFLIGFSNARKSQQRGYLNKNYSGEFFSVRDIIKINHAFGTNDWRNILRFHLYNNKNELSFIIPAGVYPQLDYSGALLDLMESLVSSQRLAAPTAYYIPLDVIATSLQYKMNPYFKDESIMPLFHYYPITKSQWHDLSQSLNAYSIWSNQ